MPIEPVPGYPDLDPETKATLVRRTKWAWFVAGGDGKPQTMTAVTFRWAGQVTLHYAAMAPCEQQRTGCGVIA